VQNDVNRKRPTLDLMLSLFTDSPAERLRLAAALSSDGTLVRNVLVESLDDPQNRLQSTLARPLRTDQRIADYLLDRPAIDSRLRPFASFIEPCNRLADLMLPHELFEALANIVPAFGAEGAILLFRGPDGVGKRTAATALSAALHRSLLVADLRQAVLSPFPLSETLARLNREAALHAANLFLANADSLLSEKGQAAPHLAALESALSPARRMIFLGSESAAPEWKIRAESPLLSFDFPVPAFEHRVRFWQEAIHQTGIASPDVGTAALANKFVLTGGAIHSACRDAALAARLDSPAAPSLRMCGLQASARAQSNHGLGRLAQKVEARQQWSDLVLPARAMQQLRAVSSAHKYRHIVYSRWGFEQRLALGKGLNVLFWGPSGTGKTMAAGVLARDLGLDIYKIDLSSVVSKYIGETEKQLSQLFREAQASNAILFFDEADALFGKRSEVKDAHDRYANVETAYLLQKMEEYDGIVILTTNFRKNMDDAFARRMHHVVEFPFSDSAQRLRIWKGLIRPGVPLASDVDFCFLARQFELAGGNIRNIVLAAAFLAAEQGRAICMEHFIAATAGEMLKMGKIPSKSDFREYLDSVGSLWNMQ
jgi:DNA polymerase III delta prime subunit